LDPELLKLAVMNIINRKFLIDLVKIAFIIIIVKNFNSFEDFYDLGKVIGVSLLSLSLWFLSAVEIKSYEKYKNQSNNKKE